MLQRCLECGAPLNGVAECREYLNEMIRWDFEDFAGVGRIHHLTVLSYNLQHPSVYSVKGLGNAKESLVQFLENPEEFMEHDARNRRTLASETRDWKIAGTPEDHGAYPSRPVWRILASDVVQGGLPAYAENVKEWARSVRDSLRDSGDLQ